MRKYEKPSMMVERFRPNVAVARCSAETISHLDNVTAMGVVCINSGRSYDYIFGQGNNDCKMTVCHYVYLDGGTYTASQLRSKGLSNFYPSMRNSFTLSKGYYGCFTEKGKSGNTTHAGSLAGISQTVINSSY